MWYGGASFGNRFFISSYPFMAFGLMHLIATWGRRTRYYLLLTLLTLLLIVWNAGLLIQYGVPMISREKEEGWAKVLENQFTEVPMWVLDRLGI